jgi:hypothetical protein
MDAEVCRHCKKLAVYQDGLCGHCFSYRRPSEAMCIGYIYASNFAEQIPYTCGMCHENKQMPWQPPRAPPPSPKKSWAHCQDCGDGPHHVCQHCEKRLVYKMASEFCDECDLFQSTGCPECDAELDWPVLAEVDPKKQELFLCKGCEKNRALKNIIKEGYVEMADILAGQRVSAEQFFDAARCAEAEKNEDVIIGDPKKMSKALLNKALREVDEARTELARKMRKDGAVAGDEAIMASMNAFAQTVVDEMARRA